MVIRKAAIDAVQGFDERFFMYWEDADICRRLRQHGWKIVYFPMAKIYHHTGASSDTAQLASIFHFHKSCYLLYEKYSRIWLKPILPLALIGLSLRCLSVMGLNRLKAKIKEGRSLPESGLELRTPRK
jgi:GT2 family glycosyltransferase